jgi:hypothetical protein
MKRGLKSFAISCSKDLNSLNTISLKTKGKMANSQKLLLNRKNPKVLKSVITQELIQYTHHSPLVETVPTP